jgi:hypothetical protein
MPDVNEDRGFADPPAADDASKTAHERFIENLDIVPPGGGDDSVVDDPSIAPEQEASYEALLAKGWTIEESRSAVKSGLAQKILNNMAPASPEPKSDESAADSADGNGDERADEISALKAQIRALEERVGRNPDATDDLILGEGLETVFGKDRWVQPDSEFASNRARVKDAVETLKSGLKAQGKAIPSAKELVQRAVRMEFGDELVANARRPVERRQQQFTARPTARPTRDDIPGESKARRTLSEGLQRINRQ